MIFFGIIKNVFIFAPYFCYTKVKRMRCNSSNTTKRPTIGFIVYYSAFFLLCLFPLKGFSQDGDRTVDALVEMGFENVGWADDGNERIYTLQNSAYRLNGVGIGKAVDVIREIGLPEGKPCRIIVLDNNIPQISLCFLPVWEDSVYTGERRDWHVSYDLGGTWKKMRKVKKKNSSLFKVDILVYPQLSFKNLIITQIYQALFDLSPAIEVSLWKGMKLTGQLVIPVYNDGYGRLEEVVHPGHLTVSQSFRLPYNVFGKLTAGFFNASQYGVDLDMAYRFPDERFSLLARVGATGNGYWDAFTYHYDPTITFTWSLGGSFYWPLYNTQFNLKVEQYLQKEVGAKFEVIRHFRYCSIGLYAMKAKGININGRFLCAVGF